MSSETDIGGLGRFLPVLFPVYPYSRASTKGGFLSRDTGIKLRSQSMGMDAPRRIPEGL